MQLHWILRERRGRDYLHPGRRSTLKLRLRLAIKNKSPAEFAKKIGREPWDEQKSLSLVQSMQDELTGLFLENHFGSTGGIAYEVGS